MAIDGEWQLVTRKAKQPNANANANAKAKKATTAGFAYKDDGRRQSRESSDSTRRDAICERVARVAAALRTDDLVQHTVLAIANHWRLQGNREGAADSEAPESEVHVVSYGLGSFCVASNAVYQLAFAYALREALAVNAAVRVTEIFDPVMNEVRSFGRESR